jgi:hypothetical protein
MDLDMEVDIEKGKNNMIIINDDVENETHSTRSSIHQSIDEYSSNKFSEENNFLGKIQQQYNVTFNQEGRDAEGFTKLHWASYIKDTKTILKLLQDGVDVNDSNNKLGQSPLHWACMKGFR